MATAFVTGAAKRLGKAIALGLAKQGYDIALHYHHSQQEAEEVALSIEALGRSCKLYQGNLLHSQFCKEVISRITGDMDQLSVLVNSASLFQHRPFMEVEEEDFDSHMAINLKAPFFLSQYFAKIVKSGCIVNMVDTYVTKNRTPYMSYLLSKKALYEFTKMAAWSLAPAIRVNGVCPGLVDMTQPLPDHFTERKKEHLPAGKLVAIEDVVSAVLSLVNSDFLTGQFLYVDSGEHLL